MTDPEAVQLEPCEPGRLTPDELRSQFELNVAIRDTLSELIEALNQIQRVRDRIDAWVERTGDDRVRDAATSLKDKLISVETELINLTSDKPRPGPNRLKEKLEALSSMIDESDDAPTRGAIELYAELRRQLEERRRKLTDVLDEPVRGFNELVGSLGVPLVGP